MFPEERYDWMRQKDGDYEIENTLCFSHHGAMLFIGERIKGLNRVIHAKDKKALLDKEVAAKKKLDDKNTLQARADAKVVQCMRCDGSGRADVYLFKGKLY